MEIIGMTIGYILAIALFVGCAALFLAPAIIAHRRNHPSAGLIAILNIFLAWIPFVWIGLLIWAIFGGNRFNMPSVTIGQPSVQTINVEQRVDSPSSEPSIVKKVETTSDHLDALTKIAELRQSGVLDEAEFLAQKARIFAKIG